MSEYDKTNYKTILDDVLSVFENQIKDTSIDYTPITPDKSGTINDYLKRLQKQSQEVSQSEFSTIQSQEQLNKAVSFVRNKKWRNTMEEKNDDKQSNSWRGRYCKTSPYTASKAVLVWGRR